VTGRPRHHGPASWPARKVGTWGFGNSSGAAGLLRQLRADPGLENGGDPATQYQQVTQNFDMVAFLNHEINAAEAMVYNEYAQVLESTNPETGELYKPDDLNVFNWNDYRSAMLQDAIWARQSWLNEGGNKDVATRFVRASLKGWMFCRDNPDKCVQYTTDAGSQLGAGHQAWMMNEINALIWPSIDSVGMMDPVGWTQTVKIAKQAGIIKELPSIDAYTTEIVKAALAGIDGNTTGEGFVKAEVAVTPGGN
jgi:NitT/TauT family transport system substrate-binding protein